jgi:hypothetical protein
MAKFMDVHNGFFGVTAEQLRDAHNRDLAIQESEDVVYGRCRGIHRSNDRWTPGCRRRQRPNRCQRSTRPA